LFIILGAVTHITDYSYRRAKELEKKKEKEDAEKFRIELEKARKVGFITLVKYIVMFTPLKIRS